VADYSVNIAVAVKNSQAVTQLSGKIKETGLKVNQLNNLIENFADITGTTVVNSVKNFNKALRDASGNLNNAALGTKAATEAARDYVEAQNQANAALKEQQNLLRAVRLEGKTVSATPFGPKAAPGFDPVQGRQKAVARMVMMETAAEVKIADARRKYVLEIGQIKLDLDRKARNAEIDNILKEFKLENELQDTLFKRAIKNDEEEGRKFMEQLGFRKTAELDAIAEVDRARKKAASEAVRLTGQTSPIGGAVGIPGSPAALATAARAQRIKSAQGSALIGGAFPLLFGQGVGAAFGGAAGGFGGGMIGGEFGFGLSLVGTQVGSMIDQLAQKAIDLGKALNPLTADTQVILEAVGKADTEFASLVKELEAAGESARALELATQELETIVGADGVEALEVFSNRMSGLQDTFGTFITFVSAKVAQAINDLTGETPFVQEVRSRTQAVSQARGKVNRDPTNNSELAAALKALDEMDGFGVDPKDRIAQQERIVELLNKGTEAERNRLRLNELAQKQGKDQARIVRASTAVTALQVQLLESGVHASSEQGAVIRRRIADLQQEEAITKAYKDFATDAISKDTLRARLADARVNHERAYAQILKDVNDRATRLADKEDRDAIRQQKAIDRRIRGVDRELDRTDRAFDKASSQLNDIINKHEDKMAFEREYSRLIQEGSTPAAAKQAVELQKQLLELDRSFEKQEQLLKQDVQRVKLAIEKARAEGATTAELQAQLDRLKEIEAEINKLPSKKGKAEGAIKESLAPETGRDKIEAEMERVQGALNKLIDPANQVIAAAQAIGDAFAESFRGLITGSMSAQEALANLFQRTADHFADMAAQMIAKQIQMKILGIAMSFFNPGGGGGGAHRIEGVPASPAVRAGYPGNLNYAEGGFVSGPTRALVGEGGESEYIIPESKMRESMARYSRGARGSSVIPETGASGTSGEGGGTAVAAPIDVRYSIERINNIDYVTNDQFQQGLQQAAAQGAQRGEQNTLKRLQMSGSTRRRLGM